MELKERKRINNRLPGFTGGYSGIGGINMSSPNNPSFYNAGLTDMQKNLTLKENPVKIQPTGKLEGSQSNLGGLGPWGAIASFIANGINNGIVAANKSSDEMLADAGTSQGSIAGFGYQKQNTINAVKADSDYMRQAHTKWAGDPIGAITMYLGRRQYNKRMRIANEKAALANEYNRSGALSDYLTQQYASKYGNDDSQLLWGAARGKDKVESSIGKINADATAEVAKDEPILDGLDKPAIATGHVVRTGKRGVDTNLANVGSDTVILGGDIDIRNGMKFQDEGMLPTMILEQINKYEKRPNNINNKLRGGIGRQTDEFQSKILSPVKQKVVPPLQDLANQQALQHWLENYTGLMKAKKGKDCLPGFANGSNWWIDGLGVATGLGQLFSSAFQKIKKPNSYRTNPYSSTALSGLAGININPYPMMQQMRDQERRNLYAINRAGGLSGAQKAYANIATGIGTQRNIADLGANIQAQNNQYKTNYYSTMMNAGQADRQALMAANQHDLDYFSKAHAAKMQMSQMGIYNMLNALQTGYANQFKRNTFDRTYDLYAADLTDEQRKRLHYFNS